jgi:hypothetical protein
MNLETDRKITLEAMTLKFHCIWHTYPLAFRATTS